MPYIDWYMSPTYRLWRGFRLFASIVWRKYEEPGSRIDFITAVKVAWIVDADRPIRARNDYRLLKSTKYGE